MFVKCIKGTFPYIEEGKIYQVISKTSKGNYVLKETYPPHPHTSFDKERFKELSKEDIENMLLEEANNILKEKYESISN